ERLEPLAKQLVVVGKYDTNVVGATAGVSRSWLNTVGRSSRQAVRLASVVGSAGRFGADVLCRFPRTGRIAARLSVGNEGITNARLRSPGGDPSGACGAGGEGRSE